MAEIPQDAVILSRGATFLITDGLGDMWFGDHGLYDRDRRLLNRFMVTIHGERLLALSGRAIAPDHAQYFQAAPERHQGSLTGLVVERGLHLGEGFLEIMLRMRNYADHRLLIPVDVDLGSDFAHVFRVKRQVLGEDTDGIPEVQVLAAEQRGPDRWEIRAIRLPQHKGISIHASEVPQAYVTSEGHLHLSYALSLEAQAVTEVHLTVRRLAMARVTAVRRGRRAPSLPAPPVVRAKGELGSAFTRAYDRAVNDLYALALRGRSIGLAEGDSAVAYAAGIPWYIALFGRDALLTSRMTLYVAPEFGAGSLRALARLQGKCHDPLTGEEPGKILHEYRPEIESADRDIIPRFPYYGSVDATPLFLIGLEEQYRVTGNDGLVRDLKDAVLAAQAWLDGPGDRDGDGYLEYWREGRYGLLNQGWKDSWDAVHFADGQLAEGPIALVEVQGYAYLARLAAASLLDRVGETRLAEHHRVAAERLRRHFHKDFWLAERNFYALGLDGRKQRIDALTSNGAHVLWTGIAPRWAAAKVAGQIFLPHLWSGFGVRTLAVGEGRYNPISYHNGSVWPHDNALIAEGLRRYGFVDGAMRIVAALIDASVARWDRRLPELFAGFGRDETPEPVPYPSACPVQAWSAASVPHFLSLMLGIRVGQEEVTFHPALPEGIDRLEVLGLRLLDTRLDVLLERDRLGRVRVKVHAPGDLPVHVRRQPTRRALARR